MAGRRVAKLDVKKVELMADMKAVQRAADLVDLMVARWVA